MDSVSAARSNTVYSLLAFGLRLVANMALFVGIARFYGPTAFGHFSLAHVYFSIMLLIADFGYDFFLATEIGRNTHVTADLTRRVMPLKIYLSVIAIGLMVALAFVGQSDREVRTLMMVLALGIPANTLMTMAAAVFRGNQNVSSEASVALTQNVLLLAFLVIIGMLGLPLLSVACAFVISRIYGFVVLWQKARKRFPELEGTARLPVSAETRVLVGIGFTFGLHVLFSTLYFQIDTILLSYLRGDEAVGLYQAVMKLAALVLVFNEVAITAVIPILAQAFEDGQERWTRIGRVVSKSLHLVGGFFGLLFFLCPEQILGVVYGAGKFAGAIPVMRVFAVILLVRFGMETYAMMLTTARKQQLRMIVVMLATIFNVTANLFVIPRFGILGAAWVSLGTNGLIALFYISFLSIQARRLLPLVDSGQLMIVAGFGIVGGILWNLGVNSLVAVVPLATTLSLGLIYLGFSRAEQKLVFSFFRLRA